MTDPDRAWLRSLPLLLSAAVLMLGGSWAFFVREDDIASVAAFAAALMLLGAWTVTQAVAWHDGLHQKRQTELDKREESP